MSTATTEHYVREFAALAEQRPGGPLPWMEQTRRQGLDIFAELGFPTTRSEDWKYTNVRPIEKRAYRPTGRACLGLDAEDLAPYSLPGMRGQRLVFINGHYAPELSALDRQPSGVTIGSLARMLVERPGELEPHLGRYADPSANGFAALNTAAIEDGACILLPSGQVVEEPIHLVFLSTRQQEAVFTQPRNLIIAGESSQAVVIESYLSLGESDHFTNALTEVYVGPNAGLDHYKLQQECDQAYHIATLQVRQDRNSRFISHSAAFGGRITRNDINSVLDAEGAECTMNGLYMVDGRQHVDFHTRVDHVKPHCTSREYYRGILDGHSQGVFNGRVYVHANAQKTDATQSNHNLLLSPNAEVDTKPQLEIYADDVKCAHGATVGQLDESMLFYLRSRGIDAAVARGMLTYGFAHDIIERMTLVAVRNRLEDALVNRLPVSASIKGEA